MFKDLKKAMQHEFALLTTDQNNLFVVDIDKETLWNTYLNGFAAENRQEHNCNACKSFIRQYGNVVAIKNNKIVSIWNFEAPEMFSKSISNLNDLVTKAKIRDIFIGETTKAGNDTTMQRYTVGEDKKQTLLPTPIAWQHFFLSLPKRFTNTTGLSIESVQGGFRDNRNVFERSLREITQDALETTLELTAQNSLYRGAEFKELVSTFLLYKKEYNKLKVSEKENWCWVTASKLPTPVAKIRNTAIGTLLLDLSEGKELDYAVSAFEKVVAPTNYKRPTALVTKKMIEQAEKDIQEMGYMESLGRRYATAEDVSVANIIYVDRDAKAAAGIFGKLKEDVSVNPKTLSKVEEININDFISKVLPTAKNVEMLFENKHLSNLVTLITAKDAEAPTLFKWANPFSWCYTNAVTDSIKEKVKTRGGKVDGALRFSIMWAEGNREDDSDLDAHCIVPSGNRIYYGHKMDTITRGNLDVDILHPTQYNNTDIVENITFPEKRALAKGIYKFYVNGFSVRGKNKGFDAEIEFEGETFSFSYPKTMRSGQNVEVAEIKYDGANFELIKKLDGVGSVSSIKKWGIDTNKFHKVRMIMNSPNFWAGEIGNKHTMFILEGAHCDEKPRGFFNEFLKPELDKNRRVFDILGSKMAVEEADKQLSGLGFSSTQKNQVIVKVQGKFERILKINF